MMGDGAPDRGPSTGQAVLDSLRDYGVLQMSAAGVVLRASAGAQDLLGHPPAALAGRALAGLFDAPKGRQGLLTRLRKALRETGVFRDELPAATGERRWIAIEAYPADPGDPGGEITAVCRDATAERQRRLADERLRLLTEAVHDHAICLLSPGGMIADWNAGAARLFGYVAGEVVGRHFSCFYTEEDRTAGVPAYALRMASESGGHEAEGWRVRADGGRFWASTVVDALRDDAGETIGFALTVRDITERQVAQEALRQSEEQFRLLVNGVRDHALYMLDPNGIVVSWNSGAARIKGYKADEVIGRHYSMFFTETDRAAGEPAQALYTATSQGRLATDGWRVRKDGSLFWAAVVLNAIRNDRGDLVGFAKITRDATEQRRAQAELAKTQERLFHAQKLEALGHLTGGIAHDFNNLLMVMGGQARKVKKERTRPDTVTRAAETIEAAVERGAGLTRQLLSFARRQNLSHETIALPARIEGFHELLARSAGSDVQLDVRLGPDLWPVEADPNELELAMINLAVNARDAMPDGGMLKVTADNVVLRAGDVDPDLAGEFVALRFADTGVGVPPDVLPKIFDPFFTTKSPDKGTGLGLSQVYGFARQAGGTAAAESTLGHGAAIVLYLPRAKAEPDERSVKRGAEAPRQGAALVVEDNPDVAEVTADLVQQLGFRPQIVPSADAALQACGEAAPFELVVSDVVMAGSMDGLALAGALKARHPDLPIVLVSGYPKSAGAVAGNFPMLSKPFKLEELERAVAQAQRGGGAVSNVVRLDDRRPPS